MKQALGLTKLFSSLYHMIAVFFSEKLAGAIKSAALAIWVLWNTFKRARSIYRYTTVLNLRSIKFVYRESRDQLREEGVVQCAICLAEFSEGEEGREVVKCKHRFHRNCLERWLEQNQATCPLCRSLVVPRKIVADYNRLQKELLQSNSSTTEKEHELALFLLSAMYGGQD